MASGKSPSRRLFGMIALSMGMISKEQLDDCLEAQQESKKPRQLGDIMLERGKMTEEQVSEVLSIQEKMGDFTSKQASESTGRRLLGEILVECAYIDEATLKHALQRQEILRETGISPRLGELLLAVGKLTREQLRKALTIQTRDSGEIPRRHK